MSTRVHLIGLLTALLSVVCACDKVPELPSFEGEDGNKAVMIVVNEGLFTTNTAALSVIYEDGKTYFDVFRWVNDRPLGDVAQSVTEINGYYFVAVNNSRRVEVLDKKTFKSVGCIRYKESGSPRFIAPLSDSTAMVSDLYGQIVTIRTKPPYKELEYIRLPLKSTSIEKITSVGGKVFGAYLNRGLAVFDCDDYSIRNMRLMEDVVVGELTKTCKMQVDADNCLWVVTTPRLARDQKSLTLNCIDPALERVIKKVEIPYVLSDIKKGDIVGMPNYNRVDMDPTKTLIYFNLMVATKDGADRKASDPVQTVYTLNTKTGKVEKYLELPGVSMMYGMGVSPKGEVCICDCLDYTAQRGYVRVFSRETREVKSYKVGVYPRMIIFPQD